MRETFDRVAPIPTIELSELLRDYHLGLVVIAGLGTDTGARAVQWVHSSDLADPTPFLTPRTVLLTTGAQLGEHPSAAEAEAYIERLVEAGTTALGIGVGLQWERIPPAIIEACDRRGFPLIRIPYDTPFLAVVRTAARLLEAHAAEDWRREQRLPSSLATRHRRLAAGEAAIRLAVLQLLREGHRELAERVAGPSMPPLPRGAVVVVTFADPLPTPAAAEVVPLITDRAGVLSASQSGLATVVIEAAQQTTLLRALARHTVAAGVSERGTLDDLAELIEQSRRAAELAQQAETPAPLEYRPAMHAGVLQLLHASPEAVRRAQGLLAPLRQHDERDDDRLGASLATWLRHNGQYSPAADELGVHRHTLRSRVNSAAALLQLDLDDPDARAEVWAALRVTAQQASR